MDECDALLSSDHFAHILGAILDQMSSVVRYDFFDNENSFAQAWRRILVVAATNQVGSIPSQLRRPGRFDHEITVNPPDSNARLKILRSLLLPHRTCINAERGFRQSCKDNSEGPDNDEQVLSSMLDHLQAYDDTVGLQRIAEACVGYVPADLVSLVRKAVLIAVESRSEILKISHIDKAMRYVGASVLRASSVSSISKTSWDDIVGDPGGAKVRWTIILL
jgi:SpoVK/Ycf46/Vps4 family AAA+-type ATPase